MRIPAPALRFWLLALGTLIGAPLLALGGTCGGMTAGASLGVWILVLAAGITAGTGAFHYLATRPSAFRWATVLLVGIGVTSSALALTAVLRFLRCGLG